VEYDKAKKFWDARFQNMPKAPPKQAAFGIEPLDNALDWVASEDGLAVLDFGCGPATALCVIAKKRTGRFVGVDLSEEAVALAKERFMAAGIESAEFYAGSLETLRTFQESSFDAFLLMNVLDNLKKEDAIALLKETTRLVKPTGKALVKVTPFLDEATLRGEGLTKTKDDFYEDEAGLYLLNLSDETWKTLFEDAGFKVEAMQSLKKEGGFNRLVRLTQKKP